MKKIDHAQLAFIVIAFTLLLFIIFRNTGLYPAIFSDEYIYSTQSRLQPLSQAGIPNYLYLQLFSLTNHCGDGFLDCARIINAILFVAAAPWIYLIARRLMSEGVSIFVSLLAIAGPINSYTAYFMPESFYFLGFWFFSWMLLTLSATADRWRWFLLGMVYAGTALIKPHSIFFLPTVLIYMGYVFFLAQALFSRRFLVALFLFIGGAAIIKFGLGYYFAGSHGLSLLGSMYGNAATASLSGKEKYTPILLLALLSLKGHMLAALWLYGLPILLAIAAIARMFLTKNKPAAGDKFIPQSYAKTAVFSLLILLNLMCMVALFTALIANSQPWETAYRLHMRYYNFVLPLFYILIAAALDSEWTVPKKYRYIMGFAVLSLVAYVVKTGLAPYTPSFIDCPEIYGITINAFYFKAMAFLWALSLLLWMLSERQGLRLYLFIALPLFVFISEYQLVLVQRGQLQQSLYDKAGIFTKQYLPKDELAHVVIVGSNAAGLFRSLYYLDNTSASFDVIDEGAAYDLSKTPEDKPWVLVVGQHPLIGSDSFVLPMPGFRLIRKSGTDLIDFKMSHWPGLVFDVAGLSFAEPWGTWSDADRVIFKMAQPLPEKFEIHLLAHAFGPNVGSPFELSSGSDSVNFTLSDHDENKIIKMTHADGGSVLMIKIPHPISPKTLGQGEDVRRLGLGFVRMTITPMAP